MKKKRQTSKKQQKKRTKQQVRYNKLEKAYRKNKDFSNFLIKIVELLLIVCLTFILVVLFLITRKGGG